MLLEQQRLKSGLSFLFAAGERPDTDSIVAILSSPEMTGPGAAITHRPPDGEGWVELLVSGLAFELHGLAPAGSSPVTPPAHRFGSPPARELSGLEAVALLPGPHIAGGSAMIPVVRTITGIAANLALLLQVQSVCWEPARSWMEPNYFARIILNWLSGGPFPALGLTAIEAAADGGVSSVGLAFFSGQEVRVAARTGEAPADTAKLALRMIDYIARLGPIEGFVELASPSGEPVYAELARDTRLVTVWRNR